MERIDYGRLAYEKATDIEARIGTKKQQRVESIRIKKIHNTQSNTQNEIVLAQFYGVEQVFSVVVKLNMSSVSSGFKVKLYHNNILSGEYGMEDLYLCALSSASDGVNTLKMVTFGEAFIESSEVLVIGYDISSTQASASQDVVVSEDSMLVWRYKDNVTEAVIKSFEGLDEPFEFKQIVRSNRVYICSDGQSYQYFFEDRNKNIFFANLDEGELTHFSSGIEIACFCNFYNNSFVIYKRGATMYYRQMVDGMFLREKQFDTGAIVSSIQPVARATVPSFIISNNGQNYLKCASRESATNDSFKVKPKILLF